MAVARGLRRLTPLDLSHHEQRQVCRPICEGEADCPAFDNLNRHSGAIQHRPRANTFVFWIEPDAWCPWRKPSLDFAIGPQLTRCRHSLWRGKSAAMGTERPFYQSKTHAASGPLRTSVDGAANGSKESRLPNAAQRSNGRNARQTGRQVSARYVYS
jgi:hypothetical protein